MSHRPGLSGRHPGIADQLARPFELALAAYIGLERGKARQHDGRTELQKALSVFGKDDALVEEGATCRVRGIHVLLEDPEVCSCFFDFMRNVCEIPE